MPAAALRQEAESEWGSGPRQDVAGLGRRRCGPQMQLVPTPVPAPGALRGGGGPRPLQARPRTAEYSDVWKLFKYSSL